MSKTPKSAGTAGEAGTDMPFEEAVRKLEAVVEAMESDDLPLEQLLARFEEGMRLSKICQAKLAAAELKIQELEKSITGEMSLKPLAPPKET
jgi:exodeoxyribonuclease VII small subunit